MYGKVFANKTIDFVFSIREDIQQTLNPEVIPSGLFFFRKIPRVCAVRYAPGCIPPVLPVPDTWVSSVRHQYRDRKHREVRCDINTGTGNFRSDQGGRFHERVQEKMYQPSCRAFWKSPKTAWRYMRLAQVLSPGTTGHT